MATLTPIKRMNPAIQETQIEVTIPLGPETEASSVSSVTWADASYPVKVYWATCNPKRKLPLWCEWEWGAMKRSTTITATPARCHHTETRLNSETMLTPKVLIRPWIRSRMAVRSTTWRLSVHSELPETREM